MSRFAMAITPLLCKDETKTELLPVMAVAWSRGTVSRLFRAFTMMSVNLALVATLGGCATARNPLEGSAWKLVGWTISSLHPADFTITAQVAEGRILGQSGVNSYGGPCQVGPGDAFSAGPLEVTLMAGPEAAMRAETAYLTLLGQARFYKLGDGQLILYDQGRNESLIFRATE